MKLKKIKLFLFVIMTYVSFSSSVLAEDLDNNSGFTIGLLFTPSYGVLNLPNDFYNINAAVNIETGYIIDFGAVGLSFLLDMGYSYHATVSITDFSKLTDINNLVDDALNGGAGSSLLDEELISVWSSHNITIGGLMKIHFGVFGLGVGGGLKIPFYSTWYAVYAQDSDIFTVYDEYEVTPYVKGVMEFAIPTGKRSSFVMGLIAEYNFNFEEEYSNPKLIDMKGFYVGITFGGKFGPNI